MGDYYSIQSTASIVSTPTTPELHRKYLNFDEEGGPCLENRIWEQELYKYSPLPAVNHPSHKLGSADTIANLGSASGSPNEASSIEGGRLGLVS